MVRLKRRWLTLGTSGNSCIGKTWCKRLRAIHLTRCQLRSIQAGARRPDGDGRDRRRPRRHLLACDLHLRHVFLSRRLQLQLPPRQVHSRHGAAGPPALLESLPPLWRARAGRPELPLLLSRHPVPGSPARFSSLQAALPAPFSHRRLGRLLAGAPFQPKLARRPFRGTQLRPLRTRAFARQFL